MAKPSKTALIKRERVRLAEIFRDSDENKLKIADPLIDRAAFLTVSIAELEDQINREGWTEEYQNGSSQKGVKRSAAADAHIALTKNLAAISKQLLDIVPPAARGGKLSELMKR